MKKIFQLLMIICGVLAMNSCYYDALIEEGTDNGGGVVPTDVSFTTDIQPLFARCIGCHNGNTQPNLTQGNSYNALVPTYVKANDAAGSKLYIKLPGNGHADIGFTLNANEIALIEAWINEGAKNN